MTSLRWSSEAFSNSYTPGRRAGLLQSRPLDLRASLYASQIEGVLAKIEGVEHVISIQMTRWWNQSVTSSEVMLMAPEEIVLVTNDPSRMELGSITFTYQGGRQ